jgi:hypothetical protein
MVVTMKHCFVLLLIIGVALANQVPFLGRQRLSQNLKSNVNYSVSVFGQSSFSLTTLEKRQEECIDPGYGNISQPLTSYTILTNNQYHARTSQMHAVQQVRTV